MNSLYDYDKTPALFLRVKHDATKNQCCFPIADIIPQSNRYKPINAQGVSHPGAPFQKLAINKSNPKMIFT